MLHQEHLQRAGLTPLVALAVVCVAMALPLAGQSVTIAREQDNTLRLVAMYQLSTGAPVPTRSIQWTAASPGVVLIANVPGMSYMRQVSVMPNSGGGTWVIASATVSGRVYADSVYVIALAAVRSRINAMDSMSVYVVHPLSRVHRSGLMNAVTLQACVQFLGADFAIVADTCAVANAGLPYRLPYGLAMEAIRALELGRTFIIASARR